MNDKLKGLLAGVLIGALGTGGVALARSGWETIDVAYDNIKIVMDGIQLDPKDVNGDAVEPFIYNGTTYLPVRAVGAAVGKEVSWDGIEKVVYLGAKPGDAENWLDVCGPYQYTRGEEYRLQENEYFTMSGKKYSNGFVLTGEYHEAEALFNLNGQYKSVSFTVGHIDGEENLNAYMNVYLDGIIAYTTELKYDDVAHNVTIPLNGALQMKIEVKAVDHNTSVWGHRAFGFSEGKFE